MRSLFTFIGTASLLLAGCVTPSDILVPQEMLLAPLPAAGLLAGASAKPITPNIPMHLAGGTPGRVGFAAHDDLWARAVVLSNSDTRIALVSLDLIGFDYDDVEFARSRIAEVANIDYVLIAATHTHTAPDTIGAWALSPTDESRWYVRFVADQIAAAITDAIANAEPATLRIAQSPIGTGLQRDIRPPEYIDDTLTVWQAVSDATGQTIATAVHFASHPIAIPNTLSEISSDFPHYLRYALERGAVANDVEIAGYGGVCLFFNGALAGKISPANTSPLANAQAGLLYQSAEAYGYRLAAQAQNLLESIQQETLDSELAIQVDSAEILVPIENTLLRNLTEANIVKRPIESGVVTSEVAVVRVGPIQFFAIPGMMFSESLTGQVTRIPACDFPEAVIEPALADLSTTPYFVPVGLANDMLGYLIPKANWDAQPPFIVGDAPPYGEQVSPGPNATDIVLQAFSTFQ